MKPHIDYDYAKEIYENGFSEGKYNYWEVVAAAKFLKITENLSKIRMRSRLYEFCEKYDKIFNRVTQRNQIRSIINLAMREKLNNCPDVVITEKEMENIHSIKNFKYQKFLFSILVQVKRIMGEDLYGKEKKYNDDKLDKKILLFIWNKIGTRINNNKLMMNHIPNLKIFISVPNFGEMCKLLFVEKDDESEFVKISKSENSWDKFIEIERGEFFYCEDCQEKFLKLTKLQKYCDECKKIRNLEKTKNRMKRYRNK